MNYKAFSLIIGFLVWLIATIALRVAGHHFFITDDPIILIGLYLVVIPVLGIIVIWVFNKYKLDKLKSIHSASLMVIPGMILDTFCIEFFGSVFPNLPENSGATFGSWLMWAYAIVLIFGLLRKG